MDELLKEMEAFGEDLTMKKPGAGVSQRISAMKDKPAVQAGDRGQAVTQRGGRKFVKHDSHGSCPVELMTEFLVLVIAGRMQEALALSSQILKHEPDNPLIKMYREAMSEYVQRGLTGEDEEENGEEEEEEEDGDDVDSDSDSFSGEDDDESEDDREDTKDEPSMERKTEHK